MVLKRVLFGIILGLAGINFGWEIKAKAQEHVSLDKIIKKAPQGININSYFKVGGLSNNSANLIGTSHGDSQAVYLTNGADQLGTIWTKDEATMRLNEDQTASMSMFFDDGRSFQSGDGMAFVMQNDERGLDASSTDRNLKPAAGETLGVWGDDSKNVFSSSEEIAARAIQNSWALEFDTFSNKIEKDNIAAALNSENSSFFDEGEYDGKPIAGSGGVNSGAAIARGNPHIASGYPGKAETYQLKRFGRWQYATMKHEGVLYKQLGGPGFLANGEWHHVTLSWKHADQTMTYTFDDKDAETGKDTPWLQQSYTKKIDLQEIDPKGSGKIRWGFTGSTGGNWESNLVVFEKVPGLVDVDAKAVLTDTTDNRVIRAVDSIKAGHQVKLDYDLNYASGWEPWRNVEANIDLPKNLSFTSGLITYANGQTENLSLADLKGRDVKTKLAQDLYKSINENGKTPKDNQQATLSLKGQAVLPGKETQTELTKKLVSTPATTSRFVGENAVTTATLNGFNVKSVNDPINLKWTGKSLTDSKDSTKGSALVSAGEAVTLTGNVTRSSGLDGITLRVTLGEPTDWQTIPIAENGDFTIKIPSDKLQAKTTSIEISAFDGNTNAANDLTYTIRQRQLELSTNQNLTFGQYTLRGLAENLYPDKPFKVSVIDTRESTGWRLMASLDALTTENKAQSLAGNLTYVAPLDLKTRLEKQTVLTNEPVEIANSQETKPNNENETIIAGDRSGDRGFLLHLNSSAVPGQYSGEITWELKNAL